MNNEKGLWSRLVLLLIMLLCAALLHSRLSSFRVLEALSIPEFAAFLVTQLPDGFLLQQQGNSLALQGALGQAAVQFDTDAGWLRFGSTKVNEPMQVVTSLGDVIQLTPEGEAIAVQIHHRDGATSLLRATTQGWQKQLQEHWEVLAPCSAGWLAKLPDLRFFFSDRRTLDIGGSLLCRNQAGLDHLPVQLKLHYVKSHWWFEPIASGLAMNHSTRWQQVLAGKFSIAGQQMELGEQVLFVKRRSLNHPTDSLQGIDSNNINNGDWLSVLPWAQYHSYRLIGAMLVLVMLTVFVGTSANQIAFLLALPAIFVPTMQASMLLLVALAAQMLTLCRNWRSTAWFSLIAFGLSTQWLNAALTNDDRLFAQHVVFQKALLVVLTMVQAAYLARTYAPAHWTKWLTWLWQKRTQLFWGLMCAVILLSTLAMLTGNETGIGSINVWELLRVLIIVCCAAVVLVALQHNLAYNQALLLITLTIFALLWLVIGLFIVGENSGPLILFPVCVVSIILSAVLGASRQNATRQKRSWGIVILLIVASLLSFYMVAQWLQSEKSLATTLLSSSLPASERISAWLFPDAALFDGAQLDAALALAAEASSWPARMLQPVNVPAHAHDMAINAATYLWGHVLLIGFLTLLMTLLVSGMFCAVAAIKRSSVAQQGQSLQQRQQLVLLAAIVVLTQVAIFTQSAISIASNWGFGPLIGQPMPFLSYALSNFICLIFPAIIADIYLHKLCRESSC